MSAKELSKPHAVLSYLVGVAVSVMAATASPAFSQSDSADTVAASSSSSEAAQSAQLLPYRTRITLYVASSDKKHFEEVMRIAFKVARGAPGVVMAEVYHIGDYRNVSDAIKNEAAARKIFMAPLVQPPKDLNLVSSPAWVMRDSTGVHIVEGLRSIERCIGPSGEYKEPEREIATEHATPTVGIKSF
jgi:hypothetical protein